MGCVCLMKCRLSASGTAARAASVSYREPLLAWPCSAGIWPAAEATQPPCCVRVVSSSALESPTEATHR